MDIEENCVAGASYLLENVSDSSITFTAFFAGVKGEDLPGDQYLLWSYLAAVMNN